MNFTCAVQLNWQKKGRGWTNPNPMVGAVIVKNGSIIGEGYHEKCGELHAERNAIASLTESAEGATLYVTLEPCCHLWEDTTVYGSDSGTEDRTGCDRIERSESESVRQRSKDFARGRCPGGRGFPARRM